MSETVILYRSPMRNGVFHTRECSVVQNRHGTRTVQNRESVEKLGYRECKKCAGTAEKATKDKRRKSLKRMIKDGEVDV